MHQLSAVNTFLGTSKRRFSELLKKVATPTKYRTLYAANGSKSQAEHDSPHAAASQAINTITEVANNWLQNEPDKPLTITMTLGEGKEQTSLVIGLPAPQRFLQQEAAAAVQAVVEG